MAQVVHGKLDNRTGTDWRQIDQLSLEPRQRTDTLPPGVPDLTLGYGVIAWIYENLEHPDGARAGKPFRLTFRQARFMLWFYAINDQGKFIYRHAARRLAKGSGKSPFAAVHALVELLGPCRFDRFDADAPGRAVGKPVARPWVQVVAVSREQTANTMDEIVVMAAQKSKLARKYRLQTGVEQIRLPDGAGKLVRVSSSSGSLEGGRVTFIVCDETEHWVPSMNGDRLMDAVRRNCDKNGGAGRIHETSNAWEPGINSVAEATYEDWVAMESGKSRATIPNLYDSVTAPANTALTNDPKPGEIPLREGLAYVYEDIFWTDIEITQNAIFSPTADPAQMRQFFLNQPTARTGAWIAPHQWAQLADPEREPKPGEDIVMFFDGSLSGDHTALVGCCMDDGHIFLIGHWEPEDTGASRRLVDQDAVHAAVIATREEFNVVAFWADVREFEAYVRNIWPQLFEGDDLYPAANTNATSDLIAFDMRTRVNEFGKAAERVRDEIVHKEFSHDGSDVLQQHVSNAVTYLTKKNGFASIAKESRKSPHKIDAAVCMIGARMLYHKVRENPDYRKRKSTGHFAIGWSV